MATRKTKKKPEDESSPSFEQSMERLSQIVEELESGDLTLEQSLGRFEEGVGLARSSQTRLDAAESRVEELLSVDDEGHAVTKDIESS